MCDQSECSFGQPKPEGVKQGRVLRVLIVDDNPDGAESLALLLQLWGHAVYAAEKRKVHEGGQEATASSQPGHGETHPRVLARSVLSVGSQTGIRFAGLPEKRARPVAG